MVAKKTAAKAAGKKEVATRASTAVAAKLDLDKALLADAGAGFEEATRDAYAVPFLVVLQDLSPQTKKKMSGYIEGARPGNIYNTVSQELYDGDKGVIVVPCHWSQVFIEWLPREKGGGGGKGFVAAYPPNHPKIATGVRAEKGGGLVLPNGNLLMDTRQHFVLLVDEDGVGEGCLISFKSTGLKISRRWMSQMRAALIEVDGRMVEPPMFAWQYRLKVEEDANNEGSWYQFAGFEKERVTNPDLYLQAKAFGAAMKAGSGRINYADLGAGAPVGAEPGGDGGGAVPRDLDDNVPLEH